MDVLDLFDYGPFTGPGRRQRQAERLHTEGTRSPGVLVGIKIAAPRRRRRSGGSR